MLPCQIPLFTIVAARCYASQSSCANNTKLLSTLKLAVQLVTLYLTVNVMFLLSKYCYVTRWVAFRFRLCWYHSEDLFVFFGAKSTQGAWARDRKWSREGKSHRRHRESQLTKEGRREQSAWDSCPKKHTVGRRRQWEDGGRVEKTVKRWGSIPRGFVEVSRNYSPAIACKCTESGTKVSHRRLPSSSWSWPKSVFVRLFFSFTLSVVFCVSIEKSVMPLVGNHLTNHWPWVVWFKEAEIMGVGRWRCPWCNGYSRRKWTRRHEFKSSTRLIAFHIALIPLGKVWIQLFSLQ